MKVCKSVRRLLCVWLPDGPQSGPQSGPQGGPQGGDGRPEKPAAIAADHGSLEKRGSLENREALEKLALWCERFSPTVALDESEAFDTLLLDITGLAHLFGGEAALADHVVREFDGRGFSVRVAVADTIGAAWAHAHFGFRIGDCGLEEGQTQHNRQSEHPRQWVICNPQSNNPQSPIGAPAPVGHPQSNNPQSRVPSGCRNPQSNNPQSNNPQSRVPSGCRNPQSNNPQSAIRNPQLVDPQLSPLPIAALRVPADTVELLASLGIHTIAQLAMLPRDQLSSRFGPELLLRLDQATGACDEALVACQQTPAAIAERLLEYPLWRRDGIRQVLQELIRQVCGQVADRGQGILQLNCRLEVQAGSAVQIPVGLYQPSAQADHLLGLVDLQLERLRLREPVIALQVTATATDRLEVRQLGIADFGLGIADWDERRREVAHLVDRLSSRLGREAVLVPRLLADAVPECACRLEPLTSVRLKKAQRKRASKSSAASRKKETRKKSFSGNPARSNQPPARPLWLEPQPIALTVTAILPDGPPIRFCWAGNSFDVAEWWGPERIETSWWRKHEPRRVRRDYYQVETTSGQRFWLFRRRDDDRWFLHGEFD